MPTKDIYRKERRIVKIELSDRCMKEVGHGNFDNLQVNR